MNNRHIHSTQRMQLGVCCVMTVRKRAYVLDMMANSAFSSCILFFFFLCFYFYSLPVWSVTTSSPYTHRKKSSLEYISGVKKKYVNERRRKNCQLNNHQNMMVYVAFTWLKASTNDFNSSSSLPILERRTRFLLFLCCSFVVHNSYVILYCLLFVCIVVVGMQDSQYL